MHTILETYIIKIIRGEIKMGKLLGLSMGIFFIFSCIGILIYGYITNIIYLIKVDSFIATNEAVLATIGIFIPPLGIIHGIYTWF